MVVFGGATLLVGLKSTCLDLTTGGFTGGFNKSLNNNTALSFSLQLSACALWEVMDITIMKTNKSRYVIRKEHGGGIFISGLEPP